MPVSLYFMDKSCTIMRYDIVGAWTWEELLVPHERALAEVNGLPYRVDVIVDALHASGVPTELFTHIKYLYDRRALNVGVSVIATRNPFIVRMANIGMRIFPELAEHFVVVDSIEAALALVAAQRSKDASTAATQATD
jgi:hypothetical protein